MNQAHLHLALNHFPIIGTVLGFLTLLAGILFKNEGIKKAGLGIFVFSGVMAIPAFLTGEGAEEVLKATGMDVEAVGEDHERLGKIALAISLVIGVLAFIALFIERKHAALFKKLLIAILVIAGANAVVLKYTGTTGGEIRHTEIRKGAAASPEMTNQQQKTQEQGEEEDD